MKEFFLVITLFKKIATSLKSVQLLLLGQCMCVYLSWQWVGSTRGQIGLGRVGSGPLVLTRSGNRFFF